ncbi:hypothetical protein ES706_02396 [subsurface metagenome]
MAEDLKKIVKKVKTKEDLKVFLKKLAELDGVELDDNLEPKERGEEG